MANGTSLSIGIPAFNQAEFLEATIESLLEQTRPPDEIYISDHDSTDATPEIIERYVRRGKVRAGKPPAGSNLTGQWQSTLDNLTGDWVTLLSSDDLARPRFCEVLLRGAQRRPDAALVRAGWENIDLEGRTLSKQYMLSIKPVVESPQTILSQRHGPLVSFAAFAIKRQALLKSGPLFTQMESLADWALFVQIAPFGSFIYENELISGYRIHTSDKFRQRLGMWLRDEQRMFDHVFPQAAEQARLTDLRWIEEASRANFKRYLASAAEKFTPEERLQATPDFAPWAERVGCTSLLERFAAGETIAAPASMLSRAKSLVRPLAQRLYGGLQRG